MKLRAKVSAATYPQLVDIYFIENRTRLLDIAAFLDRLDRSADPGHPHDFRVEAFREAVEALCSARPDRVEAIQMIFSDPTSEPLERLDQKSARGAYERKSREVGR